MYTKSDFLNTFRTTRTKLNLFDILSIYNHVISIFIFFDILTENLFRKLKIFLKCEKKIWRRIMTVTKKNSCPFLIHQILLHVIIDGYEILSFLKIFYLQTGRCQCESQTQTCFLFTFSGTVTHISSLL